MAQYVGKAPEIKVDWKWPDEWELVRYDRATGAPILMRPPGSKPGQKVPVLDEHGNPTYRKNKKGENLGQRYRYEAGEPEMVIGRRSPRGHIWWQEFVEETAEERAMRERASKVEAAQKQMAEAMVDLNLNPLDILKRLAGLDADGPAEFEPEDEYELEEDGDWPRHVAQSWWMLSDGSKVQGETNAREAQAALYAEAPPG